MDIFLFLEYELLNNRNECPSGTKIDDEDDCVEAARDLSEDYKMRSNGHPDFYKYRRGCFKYPG